MLKEGETLEPRHQFYYARELYYHGRHAEAIQVLEGFLKEPGAWIENQIDACLHLAYCFEKLGRQEDAMNALTRSFVYDRPRGKPAVSLESLKWRPENLRKQSTGTPRRSL